MITSQPIAIEVDDERIVTVRNARHVITDCTAAPGSTAPGSTAPGSTAPGSSAPGGSGPGGPASGGSVPGAPSDPEAGAPHEPVALEIIDVNPGAIGFDRLNRDDPNTEIELEHVILRGGDLSARVQQGDRFPSIAKLTIRDVVFDLPKVHGGFFQKIRHIDIEGLIINHGLGRLDNFLQGLYITSIEENLQAIVTIRRSAFCNCPHYAAKFRSDRERGFALILVEDCLFVDCAEPLGFKPNAVDGVLAAMPQETVQIKNNVFITRPGFAWGNWQAAARRLVRLYRAGALEFTGNLSLGTVERADQPQSAIAHAAWPKQVLAENNRHRGEVPDFVFPTHPEQILPLLNALRAAA